MNLYALCVQINMYTYIYIFIQIYSYIDAKKAALNKLAKLFYFLTCQCDVAVPAEMIIGTTRMTILCMHVFIELATVSY
jgi:hypothetical protein